MAQSRTNATAELLQDDQVSRLFDILAQHIEPRTELNWETPLDILVAAVLSAQSTDRKVNEVTAGLWRECREPEDYLKLGEEDLRSRISSIGLYRNKAKAIIGICRELCDRHGGQVPDELDALIRLPGVGRKTANVVLNVAFGQPAIAVDTHVHRVSNRTGLVQTSKPATTEEALLRRVPEKHRLHAHHYLILHGRYTCKSRRPECWRCPVSGVCNYPCKTSLPG